MWAATENSKMGAGRRGESANYLSVKRGKRGMT